MCIGLFVILCKKNLKIYLFVFLFIEIKIYLYKKNIWWKCIWYDGVRYFLILIYLCKEF